MLKLFRIKSSKTLCQSKSSSNHNDNANQLDLANSEALAITDSHIDAQRNIEEVGLVNGNSENRHVNGINSSCHTSTGNTNNTHTNDVTYSCQSSHVFCSDHPDCSVLTMDVLNSAHDVVLQDRESSDKCNCFQSDGAKICKRIDSFGKRSVKRESRLMKIKRIFISSTAAKEKCIPNSSHPTSDNKQPLADLALINTLDNHLTGDQRNDVNRIVLHTDNSDFVKIVGDNLNDSPSMVIKESKECVKTQQDTEPMDLVPANTEDEMFVRENRDNIQSPLDIAPSFTTEHNMTNGTPVSATTKSVEQQAKWTLAQELLKLSGYGWYWGPISRREAEERIKDQPDGAFLVRDSTDERYLFSLTFRSHGHTFHTRIEYYNGEFSFYLQSKNDSYPSLVSLIENAMADDKPEVFSYSHTGTAVTAANMYSVQLSKPVSRFSQVRSLQYLCRFVIRQYTRVDHIQQLPLPSSVKGWLQENQY